MRRGDGIGIEVTPTVIRAVRLSADEPGRVSAACELPIVRFDDSATVFDAFVRARARLGESTVTSRCAWFPAGSTLQRLDVTGRTGPELNQLRQHLADTTGITSTMLVDAQARRWMLALRWDHTQAWWVQELLERAGFADVTVEPAPVALARVVAHTTTVRRDASAGESWQMVLDDLPIAAVTIEPSIAEWPSIAVAADAVGLHALDAMLTEEELATEVGRLVTTGIDAGRHTELDANLRVAGDPYPPFPSHDLRAPQRVGVALGAAVGAAGLAGTVRAVDVLSAVKAPTATLPRPWAIERVPDVPLEVKRDRPAWTTRTAKLVRSWFRSPPSGS